MLLRNLIKEKVDWYLNELVYEMECITGKRTSVATLWRSLQYLEITRKKVKIFWYFYFIFIWYKLFKKFFFDVKLQKAALERNEIVQAHYLATIGEHYT